MNRACDCCETPPTPVVVLLTAATWGARNYTYEGEPPEPVAPSDPSDLIPEFAGFGAGSYEETEDGAYGQFPGTIATNWDSLPGGMWSGDDFVWKSKLHYAFRFQPPATCRMKIEWDEVTYAIDEAESSSPDNLTLVLPALGSEPKEVSWAPTASGGLCIPSGYNPYDSSTWPQTDVFTIAVPGSSPRAIQIENVRFSCVEDYVPPKDGSANGFPP